MATMHDCVLACSSGLAQHGAHFARLPPVCMRPLSTMAPDTCYVSHGVDALRDRMRLGMGACKRMHDAIHVCKLLCMCVCACMGACLRAVMHALRLPILLYGACRVSMFQCRHRLVISTRFRLGFRWPRQDEGCLHTAIHCCFGIVRDVILVLARRVFRGPPSVSIRAGVNNVLSAHSRNRQFSCWRRSLLG